MPPGAPGNGFMPEIGSDTSENTAAGATITIKTAALYEELDHKLNFLRIDTSIIRLRIINKTNN